MSGRCSRRRALQGAALLLAAAAFPRRTMADAAPAPPNAFAVQEIPISTAPTRAAYPAVSGALVVWLEEQTPMAYDLRTGLRLILPGSSSGPIFVDGAQVVYAVYDAATKQHYARLVTLPSGEHRDLPLGGEFPGIQGFSGGRLLIVAGSNGSYSLTLLDIATSSANVLVSTQHAGAQGATTVSGRLAGLYVAWQTFTFNVEGLTTIVMQQLDTGRRWTVASDVNYGRILALSAQGRLAWQRWAPAEQNGVAIFQPQPFEVFAASDGSRRQFGMREFGVTSDLSNIDDAVAIDGDLLVLTAEGAVTGFDLAGNRRFVICRTMGGKLAPAVSGSTVVWLDDRNNTLGKYSDNADVYAALLSPGPASLPPAYGAPAAVDARIEKVWTGVETLTQADRANVVAYLFLRGTPTAVPCQWSPTVRLWRAVDNEPAQPVATGWKDGFDFPEWTFFDVDVAAARDPRRHIAFFVTVDGVPTRSSVWWHAAAPLAPGASPATPTGVGSGDAVEARILRVWPRGGLPLAQATAVNVTAALYQRGTTASVPPDFAPSVTLYRALDQGFLKPVLAGSKRLVAANGLRYPVWDFPGVDVSQARDGRRTYYFTIGVAGQPPATNVWAYGRDERTIFPSPDQPGHAAVVPG